MGLYRLADILNVSCEGCERPVEQITANCQYCGIDLYKDVSELFQVGESETRDPFLENIVLQRLGQIAKDVGVDVKITNTDPKRFSSAFFAKDTITQDLIRLGRFGQYMNSRFSYYLDYTNNQGKEIRGGASLELIGAGDARVYEVYEMGGWHHRSQFLDEDFITYIESEESIVGITLQKIVDNARQTAIAQADEEEERQKELHRQAIIAELPLLQRLFAPLFVD